jgi:hypothetical protein
MPANYSSNPKNPANESGGQMMGGTNPSQLPRRNPKSIKAYLDMARSGGQTPTFTNRPGGPGFNMGQEPQPQAIPEGPQNDYEKIPFSKRMRMDPYMRAQNRVRTMLPELWAHVFPGMQQGAILDEAQMQMWTGVVEKLTGNLLKQYSKQYEWAMKNDIDADANIAKDRKYWQSKFQDAVLRGNPPINPETGEPVNEAEWVQDRLDVASEMKFKQEMSREVNEMAGRETIDDFTPQEVQQVLSKNPAVANAIRLQIRYSLGQIAGRELSDGEFEAIANDPQWRSALNEATRDALEQYQDRIIELYNTK